MYNGIGTTDEERDLGVIISSNLKPSAQCLKALLTRLCLFWVWWRETFQDWIQPALILFTRIHSTTFRVFVLGMVSHLGEGQTSVRESSAKSPKLVCGLKNKSYNDRLRIIGLTTLETRWLCRDLIETYKIVHRKEDIEYHQFLNLCWMVMNCGDMI